MGDVAIAVESGINGDGVGELPPPPPPQATNKTAVAIRIAVDFIFFIILHGLRNYMRHYIR